MVSDGTAPETQATVFRFASQPTFERGNGARTTPLTSKQTGAETFLNGITSFDGGASIPLHTHNCVESVVVLEGRAVVEIAGAQHELAALDATCVPAGVPHRFCNASQTEIMRILWIYGSTEATRTLVDTNATAPIDAEHVR